MAISLAVHLATQPLHAATLRAGAAKVDITRDDAPTRPGDGLFARALVVKSDDTTLVLVTLDAVAIENIGYIKNDYLPKVRAALERDLKIQPQSVVVNASHCHGIVCPDVAERTVQAVKQAWKNLTPVKVGVGTGREDRVMENRRLKLKSGKEADVRHAYSLPPDDEVVGVGPVDTEIGVLRLDRMNGTTLAVVYNFAVHPIQGVAGGENTADLTGFASQVIEDNLSEGTIALFVQGCAGDINPALYKDVDKPRDAEPLGNMLGLSTLKAVRGIQTAEAAPLKLIQESLTLPRGDRTERIFALEARQKELLGSLTGTSLNLKTFLALTAKYDLAAEFPSHYAHRYAQEKALGREELRKLDANNRKNLEAYLKNVLVMEELTRVQENLRLLRMHQAQHVAAGKRTLDVELVGLRLGDFVLVTSPGELTCQIGLNIKKASPHKNTFVAGYTNGYIYYAPTAEQLANVGGAQEDSDCLLAPEWQKIFEDRVAELLKKL
ncbi:MAG: hypothetical protein ACKVP0_19740 [Pirellulaceae bacterium]